MNGSTNKTFYKMVAIEPTRLPAAWDEHLKEFAQDAVFYEDIPKEEAEIIRRIGDADCAMLSIGSFINEKVINACPNLKYIGMCCSLYGRESANVDIDCAEKKGIVVTGVRDYGDAGVAEYVISELVRLLHGRGNVMWKEEPTELTDLKIGIVGMGTVGTLLAHTLDFFNANIFYFSRSRKEELEEKNGYTYLPLEVLLERVDILITCLNKNVVLLGAHEFEQFGSGKILINTSISPSHEIPALKTWLQNPENYALSDTLAGLGAEIASSENAFYGPRSAGLTSLAKERLGQKVIENIKKYNASLK